MALLLGGVLAWLITRSITSPLISAVRIAREVAEGNLCVEIKVDSQDQLGQLMQALRDMCGSLSNTVWEVRQGADNIALTAAEISSGNTDLSARTEEQAAGVEQTAATLEQLTATINNTAGNTAQVYQFVTETTAIVKQNGVVMSEVSSRIQEIYDTSSEMTAIIGSSTGLPSRPTFSRLMLPWKPHAPASPAVDLRLWPERFVIWLSAVLLPRGK